jgi:hypothetical protein
MRKFKLITQIDRINYLSDNYISYYKNFFDEEEFYFLVHAFNSEIIKPYLRSHGFTDDQMLDYDIKRFGWGDNIKLQNEVKTKWINDGYTVVYADIDERIYHPHLKEFINERIRKWIIPVGISLMQHESEPPLDKTKKVLEQRDYCKTDVYWFSKVCILAEDFEWTPGRHNKISMNHINSNVYLIDIGKMCKDFMLENNEQSRTIYPRLFWRYMEDDKNKFKKIFEEHRGSMIKLPEVIKNSMLF